MHIPFEKLPQKLQKEIKVYLETDNFQAAKSLRDAYEAYLLEAVVQQQSNFSSKTKSRLKSEISPSEIS